MTDDTFELDLTGMAHGGAAVGRRAGRAIFVPYALPGERVLARVVEDKGRYARAEVIKVLKVSPGRVQPPCPHFGPGRCWGCQWQNIAYERQLEYKRGVVIDQLERIGKLRGVTVHPTLPSPDPYSYRVHMTFTLTPDGAPALWAENQRDLIPIEECHILHPALAEILDQIAFDPAAVRRVRLQVGSDPQDRMIVIETADDLAPQIETDLPVSINFVTGDNIPVNLIGRTHVTYRIRDRDFRVTAGAFFQANLPVAETMIEEVLHRLRPEASQTVLELYSGVGLLTAFIAERAGLVISAESYPPAVSDAESNLADLTNVEIIEGPVEAVIADIGETPDVVVVDPPRTGLSAAVTKNLIRLAAPRIVYVSCDPASFARDAGLLVKAGYHLRDVQPLDMFPQTFHIECVALLERGKHPHNRGA